ncbi:MAG: immunoglobulin-like domain-containing protein [Minisyncoccota bacterium]
MVALLEKMRGDKKGWYKVSDLVEGLEIARPRADFDAASGTLSSESGDVIWDEIVSIKPVGREQVYDIEVEGTHNFVGNDIFAHNTVVLKANAGLSVQGEVDAADFVVPASSFAGVETAVGAASTTPSAVLTADGSGISLFKLSTYNFGNIQTLFSNVAGMAVRLTSLESRVTALENGSVSVASGSPVSFSSSSLANAFSAFGALIEKGIAQFNTLVFRQLVASTDANGDSSAGSATILAGNTVAQVSNALVLPTTKVFVTFNSEITGSWWVSDKAPGSFRVMLATPQAGDVSFDYLLVQTQGQLATPAADGSFPSTSVSAGPDTVPPVITLLGDNPVHVSVGGTFVEPGVTVTDTVDGTDPYITFINGTQQEVSTTTIDTSVPTTYLITYKATDKAGNSSTAIRSVIVGNPDGTVSTSGTSKRSQTSTSTSTTPIIIAPVTPAADTTPPVVTLVGDAAMQITVGDMFTDPGATATDDVDGTLTSKIQETGTIDASTAGLYTLTYSATDAAGNEGHVSRVVSVVAAPSAPDPVTASSTPSGG